MLEEERSQQGRHQSKIQARARSSLLAAGHLRPSPWGETTVTFIASCLRFTLQPPEFSEWLMDRGVTEP